MNLRCNKVVLVRSRRHGDRHGCGTVSARLKVMQACDYGIVRVVRLIELG